jgi:hypothetical protein
MSFAAENWAWGQDCGGGVAKSVLAYLSFKADRYNGKCWPGLDTIIKAVQHTERAVRKALDELVRRKLIEREQRFDKKGRCITTLSTGYRLSWCLPLRNRRGEVPSLPLRKR